MAKFRPLVVALGMFTCLLPSLPGAEDKTSAAIDAGIDFLLPATEKRLEGLEARFKGGAPGPTQDNGIGQLTLEVYGLVVAGVHVENPVIKRSFEFLSRMSLTHTYTVALYVFALDAAISQMEDDALMLQPQKRQARVRDDPSIGSEFRPRLKAAVEALVKSQNQKGAWRYGPGAQDFDNSNVQFAVLALGVGAKRHVPIAPEVWQKVVDHFIRCQQKKGPETKNRIILRPKGERRDDVKLVPKEGVARSKEKSKKGGKDKGDQGKTYVAPRGDSPETGTEAIQVFERGWGYINGEEPTWNMTCAGLSSLLLARDNLRGRIVGDAKENVDKAIWDGYGWVMGHWGFAGNYYGMYSLEKVGDIGNVVKFAEHDWYAEMSSHLLGSQQGSGSWAKGQWADDEGLATAYALLILNRATSLITMDRPNYIAISGRRSSADEQQDRSWVYVSDIDTSIHYPSLMRVVRLRPTGRLIQFLRNIVDNYPDMYKGELVPDLANARDIMKNATAQKIIEDYLVKITGFKYEDPKQYITWNSRWERVLKMGESGDSKYKDDLVEYYKSTTKSIPLKKTIMWALIRCKVREAIPFLLEDLNHADAVVRLEAYKSFKEFFLDFPPPFDANASQTTRDSQVAAIKTWYAKQEGR